MGSNLTLHKYTNRFYEIHQTKNEEKPASDQNKVRADIFSGSLVVCLSAPLQGEAGGRGVWGEFRPPRQSFAISVRIFSNRHRHLNESNALSVAK